MAHNTMNPVKSCKVNQCIKYLENEIWVNAIVKSHNSDYNETEIIIRGTRWNRNDIITISSDRIIDDCTAPLFM